MSFDGDLLVSNNLVLVGCEAGRSDGIVGDIDICVLRLLFIERSETWAHNLLYGISC